MILLSTSDLVFIVFYRLVIFQQDQRMAINVSVATVNCLLLSIDQLYKVVTVDNVINPMQLHKSVRLIPLLNFELILRLSFIAVVPIKGLENV